jgi:hypothetical protein
MCLPCGVQDCIGTYVGLADNTMYTYFCRVYIAQILAINDFRVLYSQTVMFFFSILQEPDLNFHRYKLSRMPTFATARSKLCLVYSREFKVFFSDSYCMPFLFLNSIFSVQIASSNS